MSKCLNCNNEMDRWGNEYECLNCGFSCKTRNYDMYKEMKEEDEKENESSWLSSKWFK